MMKTVICHCSRCRLVRQRSRCKTSIQTLQVRTARHQVVANIALPRLEAIENLPTKVTVDYYA